MTATQTAAAPAWDARSTRDATVLTVEHTIRLRGHDLWVCERSGSGAPAWEEHLLRHAGADRSHWPQDAGVRPGERPTPLSATSVQLYVADGGRWYQGRTHEAVADPPRIVTPTPGSSLTVVLD